MDKDIKSKENVCLPTPRGLQPHYNCDVAFFYDVALGA